MLTSQFCFCVQETPERELEKIKTDFVRTESSPMLLQQPERMESSVAFSALVSHVSESRTDAVPVFDMFRTMLLTITDPAMKQLCVLGAKNMMLHLLDREKKLKQDIKNLDEERREHARERKNLVYLTLGVSVLALATTSITICYAATHPHRVEINGVKVEPNIKIIPSGIVEICKWMMSKTR